MPVSTKDEILDAIANMSVLELSELLKDFEEKFGVTAAAPVAVAAPGGGGTPDARPLRCPPLNPSTPGISPTPPAPPTGYRPG